MKVKKNISYVSVALSLMWSGIYANAAEQYLLDTSVVSASGFAQDVKDAPASISVITKEELESRPVQDIAEAIRDVPGVDVTMSKTGTYNFTIRGFGEGYTLVLVDGKRQNAVNGFLTDGFGVADNAYLPPMSMIERIEVIRGPASSLYGSDAVGGVVNIITKKNPDKFTGSISLETTMQQHYERYGHSRGVNSYFAIPLIKDKLSLSLRGKYTGKDAGNLQWPSTPDPSNPNTINASHSQGEFRLGNVGGRLNWRVNEQNDIYLDGSHFSQENNVASSSSRAVAVKKKYDRNSVILNHDGNYGFGVTNAYLQYVYTNDKSSEYTNESTVYVAEGKTIIPISLDYFGNVMLTAGVQYQYEGLRNDNPGGRGATSTIVGKTLEQNTIAPYLEAEYSITDSIILTGGMRYNHSDLFDGELVPRLYLVYHLTDNLTLKTGIAKGYKTPNVTQLTEGIYRTEADSGGRWHYGNPELSPETSTNYEIGLLFNAWDYANVGLTFFQTDFEDELADVRINPGEAMPNGQVCNAPGFCDFYVNRDETRAKGVEFSIQTAQWKGFSVNSSYTYMDKQYKGQDTNPYGGKRVENLPRHTAVIKLNHTYGKLTSFLRATGRFDTIARTKGGGPGAMPAGMEKYDDYYVLDLGFNYKITKQSSISFVINNLLDKDFFEPYGYPSVVSGVASTRYVNRYQDYSPGRNFWINYKLDF